MSLAGPSNWQINLEDLSGDNQIWCAENLVDNKLVLLNSRRLSILNAAVQHELDRRAYMTDSEHEKYSNPGEEYGN